MSELSMIKEVSLVYASSKIVKNREVITYTVICDVDNVIENIETFKKIRTLLEDIKHGYEINNKDFEYTIKRRATIEEELVKKDSKIIEGLKDSVLIYSKDTTYNKIMNKII